MLGRVSADSILLHSVILPRKKYGQRTSQTTFVSVSISIQKEKKKKR